MPRPAILTPDRTAVEIDNATIEDIQAAYPGLTLGTDMDDRSFDGFPRLVMVHDEPMPPVPYGGRAVHGAPQRQLDGLWHETWEVLPPVLADLQQRARARTNVAAAEKISTLELALALVQAGIARPRTVAVVDKRNATLAQIDAATTGDEIKAILASLEEF